MSILNLIRPELLNGKPYLPSGYKAKLRLHANELPWSSLSMDAIDLNFYPEHQLQRQLQEQLARRYQVKPEEIALTRGSDDAIDLTTRLFLKAGQDAFMQCPPTFPMYEFFVRLQQGQLLQCPLDPLNDFNLSMENITKAWQPNCKIIMLCRPNNPTGGLVDLELIVNLCEQYSNRSVIVVDEAYMEFAETQSATCLIPQFENLIVLRTLSKAYGLAGLRLGAIMAQAQVIEAFQKIITPYAISSVVTKLALQALADESWFSAAIARIKNTRALLINALQLCPMIEKIYPTEANFVFVKTAYANELTAWFANQGIIIRDFLGNALLQNHLRITVGDEEQNEQVMSALTAFDSSRT